MVITPSKAIKQVENSWWLLQKFDEAAGECLATTMRSDLALASRYAAADIVPKATSRSDQNGSKSEIFVNSFNAVTLDVTTASAAIIAILVVSDSIPPLH